MQGKQDTTGKRVFLTNLEVCVDTDLLLANLTKSRGEIDKRDCQMVCITEFIEI